jgi:hypothetical protein
VKLKLSQIGGIAFIGLIASIIICVVTFIYFPKMGHDYSYVIPNSLDFSNAWKNYKVLNPIFSPLRCHGLPLWANPGSVNLSFLHFFSIFLNPLESVALTIISYSMISFIGAYLYSTLFVKDIIISICLGIGWTLQAHLVSNAIVGHLNYLIIGFFPMLCFLLIYRSSKIIYEILVFLFLAFLFSQFVFSAAHSALFIWGLAFAVNIMICAFFGFKIENLVKNGKYLLIRNILVIISAGLVVIPKLQAVSSWMVRYPRAISFLDMGIKKVIEYSFYNLIVPTPFDAKSSTGWWYGNWESNQTLFPALLLIFIFTLYFKKERNLFKKFCISILSIFVISVLINSGIYAELFQSLPILKSLHVNPRWNTIILLPVFTIILSVLYFKKDLLPRWTWIILSLAFMAFPFLYVNDTQYAVTYTYMFGYNQNINRLLYCYEPVFGYSLESYPKEGLKLDAFSDKSFDPRCYLNGATCAPGTILNSNDQIKLNEYKLKLEDK